MKEMKNGKWNVSRWQFIGILTCWVLGGYLYLLFAGQFDHEQYWDATFYWNVGKSFWEKGYFNFSNVEIFRGYFFPAYLGICSRLCWWGDGTAVFAVVNPLLVSLWFVLVLPRLHDSSINTGRRCIACLVVWSLFHFFFFGLTVYPISDLFAIMVCSISILAEYGIEELRGEGVKSYLLCVLMGATVYWAYNVRTIYMFAGIWLALKFLIYLIKASKKIVTKIFLLGSSVLGFFLAALPQLFMNLAHNIFSIKVQTDGLMLKQVLWGIKHQRYATLVRETEQHPSANVSFMDPVGNALLEGLGITEFTTWGEYFKFILQHPFDVAGIYVRHLVNMLLPCYPAQYIEDLNSNKIMYALISFTCIFLFGAALSNKLVDIKVFKRYSPLLVPVCFILPGAVESRFFAALFIMVFGVLAYNVDWSQMKQYLIRNKGRLIVAYFILGALLLAIWGNMLASEHITPIFFM